MGYGNQQLTSELDSRIDSIIELCGQLATPKYMYTWFEPELKDGVVHLGGIVLTGKDIHRHLSSCEYCVVLAVTAGMGVERELLRLQRVSMTDAVIFDACANAYVESMADYVESLIVSDARQKGMYTNYRYSPGYGDFPIQAQLDIIPALGCEKKIGLTVTDNAIMIPHKSVTAIIGVFADKPECIPHNCENCNMYDKCNIRKVGGKCDRQK